MNKKNGDGTYEVGFGKPPKSTRFQKGEVNNPTGRPRGSRKEAPYEAVLGQMVTIREDGVERRVSAAEAFLLHMTKQGLEQGGSTARVTMVAIEEARSIQNRDEIQQPRIVVTQFIRPGTVNTALEPLRMARKLDRYRETARMALQPWIVEAALARFDDKRLTKEEQKVVVRATRTPHRVNWPDWWEVRR